MRSLSKILTNTLEFTHKDKICLSEMLFFIPSLTQLSRSLPIIDKLCSCKQQSKLVKSEQVRHFLFLYSELHI